MSSTTTNLHLVKPAGVDQVDIDVINSNMDLIDTAVKSAENPIAVAAGSNTYAAGVNQLTFNDAGIWKGLDEVRLYNGTDALYCKQGVTTGLLMQDNQIKVVPVTWNGNVPAVGTMKGYISADGNYHLYDSSTSADSTSLATLRDSVGKGIIKNTYDNGTFRFNVARRTKEGSPTLKQVAFEILSQMADSSKYTIEVGGVHLSGAKMYMAYRYPANESYGGIIIFSGDGIYRGDLNNGGEFFNKVSETAI